MKIIFLLIISLYLLSRVARFFFQVGAASQQNQRPSPKSSKPSQPQGKVKGGEYVDFEDVP